MHAFTITGLPYFNIDSREVTVHFWLFGRLFEALVLLCSTYFLKHSVNKAFSFIFFSTSVLLIFWISFNVLNPPMFIDGHLSKFKVYTEYFIVILLLAAAFVFVKQKAYMPNKVLIFLLSSVFLTIGAEICFTLYVDFTAPSFVVGHLLKFLSYWSIYLAIVQTTLNEPLMMLTQRSNSYDVIPIASIRVDKNGNIVQANEATMEQFGTELSEVLHQSVHTYYHPSGPNEAQCKYCKLIRQGKKLNNEEVYFSNLNLWFLLSIAPIDKTNPVAGVVQTLSNITFQKDQESQLQKYQETLEEKVKERTCELEESLNQLNKTQKILIQSEKIDVV